MAEAKNSAAEAIKPEREALELSREKIERLVGESTARLVRIQGQSEEVLALLGSITPDRLPPDAETRRSLHEVAAEAQTKPRGERSADEYRALINVAALDEDWPLMERRASAMAYLHEASGGGSDLAFALSAKGVALGELNRGEEALAACSELLRRFGDSADASMRKRVTEALFNIACLHGQAGDAAASITALAKWRVRVGALDCAMIAGDPDFDPVRCDPAFVAILKENGCAPKRARRPRK